MFAKGSGKDCGSKYCNIARKKTDRKKTEYLYHFLYYALLFQKTHSTSVA